MKWNTYRLWKYPVLSGRTTGNIDGRYFDRGPTPTTVTFRARTENEAMKKANKFWIDGQFGIGRIFVKLELT